MIEVKKKVEITDTFLSHLFDRGELIGEISINYTYYDTSAYVYTSKNIWLRKRNNTFELKKAVKGPSRMDRCSEHTESYRFHSNPAAGIHPFASFKTSRHKYALQGLTVDVDLVDFGEFTYQVAEIECLVDDEDQIGRAEEAICGLLSSFAIDPDRTPPGKLASFLARYCPDHYNVPKTAKII